MKENSNYIPGLLFVQSILKGSFEKDLLILEQNSPLLLFFSERPTRISGHLTATAFIDIWDKGKDSFNDDPPNAALSILTDEGVTNAVVELFSPELMGAVFTYEIKIISGTIPQRFEAASLFIDPFPTSMNNRATDSVSPATTRATPVNSQITDSITQANANVLADTPATAMGNLYIATSQALSNAAHNATSGQQQSYVTSQAATTMGVATLYSLDTASTGLAAKEILDTE